MKRFERDRRMKRKPFRKSPCAGFTMIEIMVASMLLTMVLAAAFPLIRTGKAIAVQKQRAMEIEILGDSVFKQAEKELQIAMNLDEWDKTDTRLDQYGLELEILAEPMEDGWYVLRVELSDEATVQYIREERILVLNYGLRQKSLGQ